MADINVTPLVVVMLVLLIIFMVTAPLITPSTIDLPSMGKASRAPDQKVEIVIGKDESLELKTDARSVKTNVAGAVAAAVDAQRGKPAGSVAVIISADRNVKYENVVRLMDQLQRANVQRVGLSVQIAK
jgi:biopolymer transport protein TolR